MSLYDAVPSAPPDPILGIGEAFGKDPRPDKLTLVTGYFRDSNLSIPLLRAVMQAEQQIAKEQLRRPYLPIEGDRQYIDLIGELAFGERYDTDLICGFQTVGGTGALCLCGRLISHFSNQIAISKQTWANHWNIFKGAGLQTPPYPYYEDKTLRFDQMVAAFDVLPQKTAVLLHAGSHNPTGCDLSHEQWKELAQLVKRRRLYPVVDMAYQGFAKEPYEDAFAPRLFIEEGIEFALTYTASKNFSIYGERAGALYLVLADSALYGQVASQLKVAVRQLYSEPPHHAAAVVKGVLRDPKLKAQWLEELGEMRERMSKVRADFVSMIGRKDPRGNWERFASGKGLFCLLGLNVDAVERLRREWGIYVTAGGRINLTGLNETNLERVVDAICACL